ncbi:MAG: hypothetical protein J3K34DRAFT_130812 [Monoraphidium minutum]|nr:MAG: hypothetical protein J3K34DRAFT_130812 [Monoraphidium minutum]
MMGAWGDTCLPALFLAVAAHRRAQRAQCTSHRHGRRRPAARSCTTVTTQHAPHVRSPRIFQTARAEPGLLHRWRHRFRSLPGGRGAGARPTQATRGTQVERSSGAQAAGWHRGQPGWIGSVTEKGVCVCVGGGDMKTTCSVVAPHPGVKCSKIGNGAKARGKRAGASWRRRSVSLDRCETGPRAKRRQRQSVCKRVWWQSMAVLPNRWQAKGLGGAAVCARTVAARRRTSD